ncbi:MAG: PEP-CTERM sorting domain-containing protein [Sedimentisphaerales bacterium]|nr:PEP-CTERM sorting domain-containing protein [Sedimentisphaerales bacterium]MBN2843435.1 PEP-CTERM sorting domain-containing protein [Sedimentisphaerales bacterium]
MKRQFFGILCSLSMLTTMAGAATVAHWDFADDYAVSGGFVGGSGLSDTFVLGSTDLSGNGNHLTAWDPTWMSFQSDSVLGDMSMGPYDNNTTGNWHNNYPAAGTNSSGSNPTGIDLETWTPSAWTIETVFKASTFDTWNNTIIGRDGYGLFADDLALAPLYFGLRPNGVIAIQYTDLGGVNHNLTYEAGMTAGVWHHMAATSDGTTLSLYLDKQLVNTLDMAGTSTDTSLAYDTDVNGDSYAWTVSRGMYNNVNDNPGEAHVDRFRGLVDEVAFSDEALNPSNFVVPEPATMAILGVGSLLAMRRRR